MRILSIKVWSNTEIGLRRWTKLMADSYVFISYSREDRTFVGRLADTLRKAGVQPWTDVENIAPGANWQKEIEKGLLNASVLIYVSSKNSLSSEWMKEELTEFLYRKKQIIPIIIDDEGASKLPFPLRGIQWVDFREDYSVAFQNLLKGIHLLQQVQQPEPIERPELKSKGYVFVSYAEEDSQFVEELKSFLGIHGYAYWDFRESERNYEVDYSLELESVIKDAAATLSVISPNWKQSRDSFQEFLFSEHVGTPVFLLKAGEPGPTLKLEGLNYIDFTIDRDKGFGKLERALKRKGIY
jgi:hypothetical protein